MLNIILASKSPRRRELLKIIFDEFDCIAPDVDETIPCDLSPQDLVMLIARRKAAAVMPLLTGKLIIAADTLVFLDNKILGKPDNETEAESMLRALSNKTHTVCTGVCVIFPNSDIKCFCETSKVTFYPLSDQQIADYIATGEPMDKAGAYGIQEKGALLVKGIEGDYFNIVGLPIARLALELGL